MKKILAILIVLIMIISFDASIAFASNEATIYVEGEYEILEAVKNIPDGGTLNIYPKEPIPYFGIIAIYAMIDITKPCTLNFHDLWFIQSSSPCSLDLIEVNADDVTLNFYNCKIQTTTGEDTICTERGSVIHVDGDNCIINGHKSTLFSNCKTLAKYGGAIYIDDGSYDCQITGCNFEVCQAATAGNAIYASSDGCVITDCNFDDWCWFYKKGWAVYGEEEGQTKIVNCNPDGSDYRVYYGCNVINTVGSVLSVGYPEIIFGIGGLAVGFFAGMLIFRKKKTVVSTTTENEE